jgi:hypothetical protein
VSALGVAYPLANPTEVLMRHLLAVLLAAPTGAMAQDLTLTVEGITPGADMTISVSGALAGQKVRLARSQGLSPVPVPLGPGILLDLARPRYHGTQTASPSGTASWVEVVPGEGQICWQAMSHDAGALLDTIRYSDPVCVFTGADSDGDGVIDPLDRCEGFPDSADDDEDGYPNDCDVCPADPVMPEDDRDGDGVCFDVCVDDPENDADGDGICGDDDACPYDADNDIDGDGVCGDVDICPFDRADDTDGDGLCDSDDDCVREAGFVDSDFDGVCDADDICPDDPYDGCVPFGIFVSEGRNGRFGSEFGVYDPDTGVYTMLNATADFPMTGLSFGDDAVLYGVEGAGRSNPFIIEVNPIDGSQVVLSESTDSGSFSGFSHGFDGQLYGWTENGDDFIHIDPLTGVVTLTSVGIGTANNCMARDIDGNLYLMTSGSLYLMDILDPAGYVSLGSVSGYSGGSGGSCTFHNGFLYKASGGGNLYEIDVATMTAFPLGLILPDGTDAIASATP